MSITFPLNRSAFADRLKIAACRWQLMPFVETSGTALGQVITNEIAPRRWHAEVELARMPHAEAAAIQATIEVLGPSGTFFFYDPAKRYPTADPDGSIVAGASPTIASLGGNNRSMTITGLPSGYVLTQGDMLSFGTGGYRALHRVAETVTAAGGTTPSFEVRPYLRSWAVPGLAISLTRAYAKMMLEPGSFDPGTDGPVLTSGMSFAAIEVR
jgi:hypothetical protein